MIIKIPSNFNDIWSKLAVLLGLKPSGSNQSRGFDTLTKASNLIDELYIKCEIQNEQQYRKYVENFSTS